MSDPRVDKLAELLVHYCVDAQPGQWIIVGADVTALPLIEACAYHIVEAGAHVNTFIRSDGLDEIQLRHASDEQLEWTSPLLSVVAEKADGFINIRAGSNTRALTSVDPGRMQIQGRAMNAVLMPFFKRIHNNEAQGVITQYPCAAYAQEADMSLREYEDFVYGATFADQPDPVAKWTEIHDMQQRMVDWLAGKQAVVVRGPNCDLTLSIAGRTFVNSDGKGNMPSGEIFTSPVEDSVNGWVNFDYPAIRGGREVEGVRLEFEDGRVVKASASKAEDYLLSQLDLDEGARTVGEFAIGTNYGIQKFTKNILFDEKIGGTMHMAVGRGFPEAGGVNESAVHWDFICGMQNDSEILVDGELLYRNGEFQI